jgi:hypothetical protein
MERRRENMRKLFMFAAVLLVILATAPAITHAIAVRTALTGTLTMSVTSMGNINVTKNGIMRQTDAQASGPLTSTELSGQIQIVLNAVFNLNTGEGIAFGTFTITNDEGTFAGVFRVHDTQYIQFKGTLEARGTGLYAGMILKLKMTGTDLYRGGYTGADGLSATFEGYTIST